MKTVEKKVEKKGKKNIVDLEEQLNNAFNSTRERMASSKVSLERKGASIYLLGTLPSELGGSKRQWIPMGKLNLVNLLEAERLAGLITQHLAIGHSDWWSLLPKKVEKVEPIAVLKPKTMGEIEVEYKEFFFSHNGKTRKSESTWRTNYDAYFRLVDKDDALNEVHLTKWMEKTKPNSRSRKGLIYWTKLLVKHYGYDSQINWNKFPCNYAGGSKRDLPSDEYIEQCHSQMRKDIAWTFGMIATYGLRPQEIFITEESLINKFLSPGNTRNVFYVAADTKTGEREVYPLHPEWVKKFDLKRIVKPKWKVFDPSAMVIAINRLFHRCGFTHPAYDLRHRYAIRASELGVTVEIAAKWMGHTLKEHFDTYQKWMDADTHNKEYDKLIRESIGLSEVEQLREENRKLRARIKELEAR